MSAGEAAQEQQGIFLLSQISNEMVRIYKDQFGRGAHAHTHVLGRARRAHGAARGHPHGG